MFGVHVFIPLLKFNFDLKKSIAYTLMACGAALAIIGILHFHKAKTTVHPLKPEKATSLVTGGIYRYTRNPMYLGLTIVLTAWGLALGNALGFLVIPLFIWYMTEYQIKPEESAMHKLFGEAFTEYKNKVRRWL